MTMHDDDGVVLPMPAQDIETSPQFGSIAAAIAKAQCSIDNAEKDAKNPHFNSKYATLASVYAACRTALAEAGVAVIQAPFNLPDGDIGVSTMLAHSSGEWMKARLYCKPTKYDAHGLGSIITYLRRYSLSAMVGVAPEDDDGNAGVGKPSEQKVPPPRQGSQGQTQQNSGQQRQAEQPRDQQGPSEQSGGETEQQRRDRIQAAYTTISKEIAEAIDHGDLDDMPVRYAEILAEIKEFSPTSYEKLKQRVAKRKEQITAGPGAADGEPKI